MKYTNRIQLIVAGGIIFLLLAGLFFYYLTKTAGRFESDRPLSFPTNDSRRIINEEGNIVSDDKSNQGIKRESGSIRRVSQAPIAGYAVTNTDKVRYLESATGHVYEFDPLNGSRERLTNTSFQRVIDAAWINDESVLITYDDDGLIIKSMAIVDLVLNRLNSQIFPNNTIDIVGHRNDSDRAYYLASNNSGGSTLYEYTISDDQRSEIVNLPISQLDLHINDQGKLFLSTKPDQDQSQTILEINNVGNYEIMPINPKPNHGVLIDEGYSMFIRNDEIIIEGPDNRITYNSFTTSDKCDYHGEEFVCAVATLSGNESRQWPFNWFKGKLQPNEQLVSLATNFGNLQVITDLGDIYDAEHISTNDRYVYLISRTDGYLYEVLR